MKRVYTTNEAKAGNKVSHRAHTFKKQWWDPLCQANIFSCIQILETMSLTSSRVGVSIDFHFLAVDSRAAWGILEVTLLCSTGTESIPKSSKANSGPLKLLPWVMERSNLKHCPRKATERSRTKTHGAGILLNWCGIFDTTTPTWATGSAVFIAV